MNQLSLCSDNIDMCSMCYSTENIVCVSKLPFKVIDLHDIVHVHVRVYGHEVLSSYETHYF